MKLFIFYIFSAITILSACSVVVVRNSVTAALFLVLTFVASAGLWILLEAEFLALTLIMVYVGAVMVLFLFVVMMININYEPLSKKFVKYLPLGSVIMLMMIIEMFLILGPDNFGLEKFPSPISHLTDYNNTAELGIVLYTDYVYPFEIAGIILLVAIISAIALTLRQRQNTKYQDASQQVSVKRKNCIRIVQMNSKE